MLFSSKTLQQCLRSRQLPLTIKDVVLQMLSMLFSVFKLRLQTLELGYNATELSLLLG